MHAHHDFLCCHGPNKGQWGQGSSLKLWSKVNLPALYIITGTLSQQWKGNIKRNKEWVWANQTKKRGMTGQYIRACFTLYQPLCRKKLGLFLFVNLIAPITPRYFVKYFMECFWKSISDKINFCVCRWIQQIIFPNCGWASPNRSAEDLSRTKGRPYPMEDRIFPFLWSSN